MDRQEEQGSPLKKQRSFARRTTRRIALSAIFVALSFTLSLATRYLPFMHMPQGGSISLEGLGLLLAGLLLGPVYGTLTGVLYGLVDFMMGGFIMHWGSIFMDYLFAFGFIGLAGGLFSHLYSKNRIWSFFVAAFFGFLLRYLCSSFSGVWFFAQYAKPGMSVWFYSFIFYNLPYCSLSMLLVMVVGGLAYKPLQRLTGEVKNLLG